MLSLSFIKEIEKIIGRENVLTGEADRQNYAYRISYGVGVEKVFPVHSPSIVKVETVRHGYVRRAKLYYLRDRVGKAAKVREKL